MTKSNNERLYDALYHSTEYNDNLIGEGFYSKVYKHPDYSDRVIKISENRERKDGAIDFYSWAFYKDIKLEGIPVIHNIKEYKDYTVVEMNNHGEALIDVYSEHNKDLLKWMDDLAYKGKKSRTYKQKPYKNHKLENIIDRYMETLLVINEKFGKNYEIDIHGGNITVDKDKNIWFIDPVAFLNRCALLSPKPIL